MLSLIDITDVLQIHCVDSEWLLLAWVLFTRKYITDSLIHFRGHILKVKQWSNLKWNSCTSGLTPMKTNHSTAHTRSGIFNKHTLAHKNAQLAANFESQLFHCILILLSTVAFCFANSDCGWNCVSKIRPANALLTFQSSQQFSLANHSVAVDRTATQVIWAAGVSKVIHDVRAASNYWPELAHLVHRVLSFVHCNVQCLEQFLSHASGEIKMASCRLLLLLLALADHHSPLGQLIACLLSSSGLASVPSFLFPILYTGN